MRKIEKIIAGLLVAVSLTACGGQSSSSSGTSASQSSGNTKNSVSGYAITNYAAADTAQETASSSPAGNTDTVLNQDKLVYSGSLEIETLEYDDTVKAIRERIAACQGIIESEQETDSDRTWYYANDTAGGSRTLYLTARIPTASFSSFMDDMAGTGKVMSRSTDVVNISRQYSDNEAEISALEIQEQRLLTMMEQAATVEDMITIEDRLTEVQTDLNKKKSERDSMDTDVEYSTVTMTLEEVLEYTPTDQAHRTGTFTDRLVNTLAATWSSFLQLLEGVLFFLIRAIPYLVIFVPLFLLARFLWRKIRAASGKPLHPFGKKKNDRQPATGVSDHPAEQDNSPKA